MNRIAVLCVALTASGLVAGMAGCGSDPPSAAPDSPPPSSRPATSASSAPSISPASGPLVDGVQVSFHVPPGWKAVRGEVRWEHRFVNAPLAASGQLTEQYWPSDDVNATPRALNQMVAATKDTAAPDTHWRRLPDLTVAGLPFYHLAAKGGGQVEEQYGSLLRHHEVVFDISWLTDSNTAAQRRRLTAQILASVTVK